ncbi:MAG: 1-deoxy-D-xylulose-5-phosphate synthase [Umezawaea sp.]
MVERLLLDEPWSAVHTGSSGIPEDREHRLLDGVDGPEDVRALRAEQLPELADELRALLVEQVTRTGGHLGPNLGVVELTIALHRVFDSPRDTVLWDTGHQSYVHKALTGRWRAFDRLRGRGGLSGYPARAESPHDHVENSHASTALSWAYGVALGHTLLGEHDRRVVAVVGDGALTGGMAWEALNNIGGRRCRVVIVLNDNGRSYAPTVGGLAEHLTRLRTGARPDRPGGVFAELGLTYLGPVDGHDVAAVEKALAVAAADDGPVVVHCVTSKGRGHAPAERHEVDQFHAVRAATSSAVPAGPSWTSVFGAELVRLGGEQPEVVALTAAMLDPAGLTPFARRFPDRVLDVGIAEQHAVTAAAGLAAAGARPVVAVYATFLTRALDQVLMDVALHRAPVVFVLDRAGVTGDDGASHNGVWDMALLGVVPGLWIAAPRDARTLRAALRAALRRTDGPTVVRFPKGPVGPDVPALLRRGGLDVLRTDAVDDVLLVGVGPMAGLCLEAARLLHERGVGVTVVDPRWVRPANPALVGLAARFSLVATVEDGLLAGGFGGSLASAMRDEGSPTPLVEFGVPRGFLRHGTRAEVLADCGLTAQGVADRVAARLRRPRRVVRPAG